MSEIDGQSVTNRNKWTTVPIGTIGRFTNGINKSASDFGFGVPFVNLLDIFGVSSLTDFPLGLVNASEHEIKRYNLQIGDVLFVRSSVKPEGVGLTSVVLCDLKRTVFSGFIIRFRLNDNVLDWNILKYIFHTDEFRRQLLAKSTVSANTNINQESLSTLLIDIPPLPQQKKIAQILTTVDNLIEKTEALIEKYKAIKQGMMHDLFTRGVDQNGKLRPPYEEAPHLYKESPLGWIPKEWECDHLINRISLPQGQVDPKALPYRDWVLIAPDHVEQRTGRLIATETASQQNAISGKYVFDVGDVVYSKIRPYLRKAILATHEGICSADMYPMHPSATLRPRYLLAVILGEEFSRFAESVSERSGFPKLNRTELAEFETGFPQLSEQDRICRILITADKTLSTEESTLEILHSLKSGLMQDLLTGKVRVNVDDTEEELANA